VDKRHTRPDAGSGSFTFRQLKHREAVVQAGYLYVFSGPPGDIYRQVAGSATQVEDANWISLEAVYSGQLSPALVLPQGNDTVY
jgi:hypothetical protein